MGAKTISIIIPTYQHAQTLPYCVDSILKQTVLPAEIIVVDDGSTDRTPEVLEKYGTRIKLIRQRNQGGPVARNNGFAASTGDYVLFCDADVQMHPPMLAGLSRALDEHPEASYAYCRFKLGWKKFYSYPFSAKRLRRFNYIHTSSLIRREHFPGFDSQLRRFQDWDLWLTMLEHGHSGIFVKEEFFHMGMATERTGISTWVPSSIFKVPWRLIGWAPPVVRYYEQARQIIFTKHHLKGKKWGI